MIDLIPPKPIEERSPQWPAHRKAWLEAHPTCAACGTKNDLEVHHKMPVSWDPDLELVESNYITLCEGSTDCHFIFGHLKDWKSRNPHVETDAAEWLKKIENRPYPKDAGEQL